MYLRLVSQDALIFIDKTVAAYRIHSFNTSRTKDVQKRIKNLSSQKNAGQKNLLNFNSFYRILLKSEINLLNAKIYFLSKEWVGLFKEMFLFFVLRGYSVFRIKVSS